MKIKITESQHDLIKKMTRRKNLKEQEFLAQQTPVNIGEGQEAYRNYYDITITINAIRPQIPDHELDRMSDEQYWELLRADAHEKVMEAFNTAEIFVRKITTPNRGEKIVDQQNY